MSTMKSMQQITRPTKANEDVAISRYPQATGGCSEIQVPVTLQENGELKEANQNEIAACNVPANNATLLAAISNEATCHARVMIHGDRSDAIAAIPIHQLTP